MTCVLYVYQQIGSVKKKGKKEGREREGSWPFLTENLRSTLVDEARPWALQARRTSTATCMKEGAGGARMISSILSEESVQGRVRNGNAVK